MCLYQLGGCCNVIKRPNCIFKLLFLKCVQIMINIYIYIYICIHIYTQLKQTLVFNIITCFHGTKTHIHIHVHVI